MREAAATLEKIHTCFEKEAAAASTQIHILFPRDVATGLETIHTCFTKEVATASIPNYIFSMRGAATTLKKITTFFENSELLGAKKYCPWKGKILMGQNFCLWQWALPKHNFYFLSKY
jgi:hypothetical protein